MYDRCAEIAGSTPPAEPSAQQFAKRPPEGEKLIKPPAQVECFIALYLKLFSSTLYQIAMYALVSG